VHDQPLLYTPACDHRPARCYFLDRVLVEQKKKHVAIILAHPLVPDDTTSSLERSSGGGDDDSSSGSSQVVVSDDGGETGIHMTTTTTTTLEQQPPQQCWQVRGSRVVVKVVPHHATRSKMVDNPLEELAALSILSSPGHDNVIRLLDYFQDEEYIYMVLPYLKGGDLFTKVSQSVVMVVVVVVVVVVLPWV